MRSRKDPLVVDRMVNHPGIAQEVIEPFAWPEGQGSFSGAGFWAALVNLDHERIFGEFAYRAFSWGE